MVTATLFESSCFDRDMNSTFSLVEASRLLGVDCQHLLAQGQTRFIDQLNTMGLSPLHTATLRGSASTVQALLQVQLHTSTATA